MTEEDLLAQIRQRPDDDAPRLLFADWLDERGDPRGEFVRLQCTLAALAADAPERGALAVRHAELESVQRQHAQQALSRFGIRDFRFSRGFIDRLHVSGAQFLELWRTLAPLAPAVRGLRWSEIPGRQAAEAMRRLMASELSAAMQSLSVFGERLSVPIVDALVGSPRARQLTALDLSRTALGGAGLRSLSTSPQLNSLTVLKLPSCELGARDAGLLARSVAAQRLEWLDVSSNAIGDEGFEAIVTAPAFAQLKALLANGNDIGVTGIASFASNSRLVRLVRLSLCDNDLGDDSAGLLATSSSCGRLEELRLDRCGISGEGRRTLERSEWLVRVKNLSIGR